MQRTRLRQRLETQALPTHLGILSPSAEVKHMKSCSVLHANCLRVAPGGCCNNLLRVVAVALELRLLKPDVLKLI
jgi:hypothetical protein